ncbi:hypothetical protein FCV25MIE_00967 [Fagus crenata]
MSTSDIAPTYGAGTSTQARLPLLILILEDGLVVTSMETRWVLRPWESEGYHCSGEVRGYHGFKEVSGITALGKHEGYHGFRKREGYHSFGKREGYHGFGGFAWLGMAFCAGLQGLAWLYLEVAWLAMALRVVRIYVCMRPGEFEL